MKITDVRTHVLEAALSQPFAYSRAWYDTRTRHAGRDRDRRRPDRLGRMLRPGADDRRRGREHRAAG